MKKNRYSILLVIAMAVAAATFAIPTLSHAAHRIVIPYSYVGDGWDTVIIVSNTTTEAIIPILYVNDGTNSACTTLDTLQPGEIYVNTFGSIGGWYGTPPIPGIFRVSVYVNGLTESDDPFGAAVAINNASFGGFSMQQFKSEYAGSLLYSCH